MRYITTLHMSAPRVLATITPRTQLAVHIKRAVCFSTVTAPVPPFHVLFQLRLLAPPAMPRRVHACPSLYSHPIPLSFPVSSARHLLVMSP